MVFNNVMLKVKDPRIDEIAGRSVSNPDCGAWL